MLLNLWRLRLRESRVAWLFLGVEEAGTREFLLVMLREDLTARDEFLCFDDLFMKISVLVFKCGGSKDK